MNPGKASGDGRLPDSSQFPNTSWGLLLAVRDENGRREAFGTLCRRYWVPIYAAVRRHGSTPADAEDLVQGFFLHLVEHDTVMRADPQRGRFRAFLLGALRWFLSNEHERETARKRGGATCFVALDIALVESTLRCDESDATLELLFDQQWAQALVRNALATLRAEYASNGQAKTYEVLRCCLNPTLESPAYAALATQLGCNENAVKVAVHRMRTRFRNVLRGEVGCTVATAQDVEDELAYLRDVLAAAPTALAAP